MSRKAIWVNVALAGVLATAAGIVTNLITDKFSWTLLVLLVVLVAAGIGITGLQVLGTLSGTSSQPTNPQQMPANAAAMPPSMMNLNVATDQGRVAQKFVTGVGGAALAAIISIVVTISALAIVTVVYRYSDDGPIGRREVLNPYNYLSFTLAEPARRQPCPGLFGLCVNGVQPLSAAEEVFASEGPGDLSEPSWNPGQRCRRWELSNSVEVMVCATDNEIDDITIFVPDQTTMRVAVLGGVVRLPASLADAGRDLHDALDREPFAIDEIDGEGYWLNRHAWHYVGSEGIVLADVSISGTSQTAWQPGLPSLGNDQPFCDYDTARHYTTGIPVETIAVRKPSPQSFPSPDCPGTAD